MPSMAAARSIRALGPARPMPIRTIPSSSAVASAAMPSTMPPPCFPDGIAQFLQPTRQPGVIRPSPRPMDERRWPATRHPPCEHHRRSAHRSAPSKTASTRQAAGGCSMPARSPPQRWWYDPNSTSGVDLEDAEAFARDASRTRRTKLLTLAGRPTRPSGASGAWPRPIARGDRGGFSHRLHSSPGA